MYYDFIVVVITKIPRSYHIRTKQVSLFLLSVVVKNEFMTLWLTIIKGWSLKGCFEFKYFNLHEEYNSSPGRCEWVDKNLFSIKIKLANVSMNSYMDDIFVETLYTVRKNIFDSCQLSPNWAKKVHSKC